MRPNMQPNQKTDLKGALSRLSQYMRKSLGVILLALILAAFSAVLTILGPDWVGKIAGLMSDGLVTGIDLGAVAKIGVVLACIYGASALFGFIQHYIMASVTLKMSYRMRAELSEKINRVPQKYFNLHSQGDILSRITNDVYTLQQGLTNALPTIISAATQFVGCLIMMFVTEWRLALAALGITLVGLLLTVLIMSRSQKYFTARQESLGALNGYVEEMFSGQKTILAYAYEEDVCQDFSAINHEAADAYRDADALGMITGPTINMINNLGLSLIGMVGAALYLLGGVGMEQISSFVLYSRKFCGPINEIANIINEIYSALAAAERVFTLLDQAEELADMGIVPGGAYRNRDYVKPHLRVLDGAQRARLDLAADPQTSGGLLVSIPRADAEELLEKLHAFAPWSAIVGEVLPQGESALEFD